MMPIFYWTNMYFFWSLLWTRRRIYKNSWLVKLLYNVYLFYIDFIRKSFHFYYLFMNDPPANILCNLFIPDYQWITGPLQEGQRVFLRSKMKRARERLMNARVAFAALHSCSGLQVFRWRVFFNKIMIGSKQCNIYIVLQYVSSIRNWSSVRSGKAVLPGMCDLRPERQACPRRVVRHAVWCL